MKIPFVDLQAQYRQIQKASDNSIKALIKRGDFILGKDVTDFEKSFAEFVGVKFTLGVNSGTDALFFSLLSLGVGPGNEVIVPAYTYIASAFAVSYAGAKPVFVDIDETTFNIDVSKIERAITKRTKAIMPVHLYGQSADMGPVLSLAKKYCIKIIEDAAQAHGADYKGRHVGTLGDLGAFSFYPTKNLGAFGDAGMVVTNDSGLFEKLKKLRDYGRRSKYEHGSLGYNSRLDSIQAIFLNEKLKRLKSWNEKRIRAAMYYKKVLKDIKGISLPQESSYGKHVYHIFALRVKNRDTILEKLRQSGIEALVHYPIPLHLQVVYKGLGYKEGDFPVAEQISREIISLPIFPHIEKKQIDFVAKKLKEFTSNA